MANRDVYTLFAMKTLVKKKIKFVYINKRTGMNLSSRIILNNGIETLQLDLHPKRV